MSTELFINSSTADQAIIALTRDGRLVELHQEKADDSFSVGDIYLGTVKKLVPGLNAAFVDVGYEKDAFLHYHDLGPQVRSFSKYLGRTQKGRQRWSLADFPQEGDINKDGKVDEVLQAGQKILVQIAKEPISTKGPRITSEISLPGRYIVLVPFSDRISISQKIKDREERERLRRLVQSIRPQGFGVIVRTVAEGRLVADIDADLQRLVKRWKTMHRNLQRAKAPSRVFRELGRASAMLRDILNDSFNNIFVDDESLHTDIQEYLAEIAPDKADIVKHYQGSLPLFEQYGIERQIKSAFGRSVSIAKGAYLIVEHTEAMHVIDVNSGNRSNKEDSQEANALETNLLAAEEVARQLRLRDMGGIIVVDFIDMHRSENRKALFEKLKEAMKQDRAKHKILPPSKFGLVEITRQRVRPELAIKTTEPNPDGEGEVEAPILLVNDIEYRLDMITKEHKPKQLFLNTHPFLAAYLNQGWFSSIRKKWSAKYRVKLKVVPRDSFKFLEYRFLNEKNEEYQ